MAAETVQARRSAATRPTAGPNARALTAAAVRLDPTDLREAGRVKNLRQNWQRDAWAFYRTLSIIHYAHDYYGNVCSRVRLYPGFQSDPDDPPIPLDDLAPDAEKPDGSSDQINAAAVDEMHRLDSSTDGGLPGLAGDFAVNLSLAGETYLYGKEDPESPTGEKFAVYSIEEFKASESGYTIHRQNDSQGQPVGADDYVLRAWRRLRQFRDQADAPMMALLDDCDNLLRWKRVLGAVGASRMHGGIFLTPSEWHFPNRATDPNAAGQAQDVPLVEQIATAFTTPLADPLSVNAVAPMHLEGPAETLDKARFIDFGRGYADQIEKVIDGIKQDIAVGLDLPIEVVLGHANTTFTNAYQIAEETFKAHIEPLVQVICRALTDGYLLPALRARGLDPEGYSVWYDPTALIGHTDLFANMTAMHSVYAVSDDALRRSGGANDDDAPSDDEILKRLFIAQQQKVTIRETGIAPADSLQPPSDLALIPNADGTPAPAVATAPAKPQPAIAAPPGVRTAPPTGAKPKALTASAGTSLGQLGPRLADIDRVLTAQIQTLADTALQRTLERAGAAVARKVQATSKGGQRKTGLAAEIQGIDLDLVPAHVGREQVLALGLSEDKLIDGQLGQLEPQYRKLTKRALAAALLAGRRAVPDGNLTDERSREIASAQDQHIAAGFAVLSAGVLAAAHDQLFTPALQPSGPGEIDLSSRISRSVIRESLSVAGGTPVSKALTPAQDATPPAGVAAGQLVLDAFKEALQVLPQGWQWVYGYPDKPFEPHENLEGAEFSSWDDDVLANDESWPDDDYFRPGDHLGCQCSFIAMFGEDRPNDTPAGDNGTSEEG